MYINQQVKRQLYFYMSIQQSELEVLANQLNLEQVRMNLKHPISVIKFLLHFFKAHTYTHVQPMWKLAIE